MNNLAGIRSELRALMALDERGEIDQQHRHKVLFQIICDLQDYEVMEGVMNAPSNSLAREGSHLVVPDRTRR